MSKINIVLINDAEDLDVVIPMYVLVEFVKNYREITGNWWSYYIWEHNNNPPAADYNADPKANSASFKYKNSIRWKTLNNNNESDRNDNIKK